MNIYKFFV